MPKTILLFFLFGELIYGASLCTAGESASNPDQPVTGSSVITEQSLCGPISLSLGAKKLGIDVEVSTISQMVKLDPSGTSMSELAKAATQLGIRAVPYRLSSAKLLLKLTKDDPAIVLVRGNHFVLVWSENRGKLSIAEYPLELRQITPEELAEEWDPRVLLLSLPEGPDPFSGMAATPLIVSALFALMLIAIGLKIHITRKNRRSHGEGLAAVEPGSEHHDPGMIL